MWRSSVLVTLLLGCAADGGSTEERIAISSGPFTPLLCTSGGAGEPTCPVNHVEFAFEFQLRVTFVMTPLADSAQLSSLAVSGSPLHVENLRIEHHGHMMLLAESIDVGITELPATTVVLGWPIAPTHTLVLSADVIR